MKSFWKCKRIGPGNKTPVPLVVRVENFDDWKGCLNLCPDNQNNTKVYYIISGFPTLQNLYFIDEDDLEIA